MDRPHEPAPERDPRKPAITIGEKPSLTIVLPFTVLRRLDCRLEPTKQAVLGLAATLPQETGEEARFMIFAEAAQAGGRLYKTNSFTFASLRAHRRYRMKGRGHAPSHAVG